MFFSTTFKKKKSKLSIVVQIRGVVAFPPAIRDTVFFFEDRLFLETLKFSISNTNFVTTTK